MSEFISLYSDDDLRIMENAEEVRHLRRNRIDELIGFARNAGILKIGIANCISFAREADALEEVLKGEGFEVKKVHCKYGHLDAGELLPGFKGVICNPAGQALFLAEKGAQMNIVMGLCVGHDMVFNLHSKVPTTTLVVKDRKNNHQPLPGLQG
jgi:uncharacterized metal-binding protein